MQIKFIKCRNCGEVFQADPGNSSISLRLTAVGAAIGAIVGSIVPGIGTALGAMMGAKCAADAMKSGCICPRCGKINDDNGS